jgi:hypothetical protein
MQRTTYGAIPPTQYVEFNTHLNPPTLYQPVPNMPAKLHMQTPQGLSAPIVELRIYGKKTNGEDLFYAKDEKSRVYTNCVQGQQEGEKEKQEFAQMPQHLKERIMAQFGGSQKSSSAQNLSNIRPPRIEINEPDLNSLTYANKQDSQGYLARLTMEQARALIIVGRNVNLSAHDSQKTLLELMGHSSVPNNTQKLWAQTFNAELIRAGVPKLSQNAWKKIFEDHNLTVGELQKGISITMNCKNPQGQVQRIRLDDLREFSYNEKNNSLKMYSQGQDITGKNCKKPFPDRFALFTGRDAYSDVGLSNTQNSHDFTQKTTYYDDRTR